MREGGEKLALVPAGLFQLPVQRAHRLLPPFTLFLQPVSLHPRGENGGYRPVDDSQQPDIVLVVVYLLVGDLGNPNNRSLKDDGVGDMPAYRNMSFGHIGRRLI